MSVHSFGKLISRLQVSRSPSEREGEGTSKHCLEAVVIIYWYTLSIRPLKYLHVGVCVCNGVHLPCP